MITREHKNQYARKYKKIYLKNNPWMRSLLAIKSRCKDKNNKYYYGRGIKCLLSRKDIQYLWDRDCAEALKKPSVDRINNKGNYTIDNCRFIETSENARLASILQKGKWARNYNKCIECGTQKVQHYGFGRCKYCYQRKWEKEQKVLKKGRINA